MAARSTPPHGRLPDCRAALRVSRWLEIVADDPGCLAVFQALDRFVDAVLRGDDVSATYADVLTHLRHCVGCREDAEGLLAALRTLERPVPAT